MKRLAAVAACVLLLAGCDGDTVSVGDAGAGSSINVWHDDQRSVTCWVFKGYQRGGLSCIPDSQLPDPDSCLPGTETPATKIDGVTFPGECVSRRYAEGAR